MRIKQLRINQFRNYERAGLELDNAIHVIQGDNGQGKTSILEAIHYACLTGSFKTNTDSHAVRHGTAGFDIEGDFVHDDQDTGLPIESSVRVLYSPDCGKTVFMDGKKIDRLSLMIGMYPLVISSPEDVNIVSGAPYDRRRFLDQTISQVSPVYLKDLQDYRQSLRQRNALLQSDVARLDLLDAWDTTLTETGSRIIQRRVDFLAGYVEMARNVYSQLIDNGETIGIRYESTVLPQPAEAHDTQSISPEKIKDDFRMKIRNNRKNDLIRKSTGVGPHKDDLGLYLNHQPLKSVGSQGQLKTYAIALKLAEHRFLFEKLDRKPILLLDDVLSELDGNRRRRLFDYLEGVHQAFVTSAEPKCLWPVNREIRYWTAQNGHIRAEA